MLIIVTMRFNPKKNTNIFVQRKKTRIFAFRKKETKKIHINKHK